MPYNQLKHDLGNQLTHPVKTTANRVLKRKKVVDVNSWRPFQSKKHIIQLQINPNLLPLQNRHQLQHLIEQQPQLPLLQLLLTHHQVHQRIVIVLLVETSDLILHANVLLFITPILRC